MSFAFITALTQNPQQTYQQLLVSIRQILRDKYSQKPQLSASHVSFRSCSSKLLSLIFKILTKRSFL